MFQSNHQIIIKFHLPQELEYQGLPSKQIMKCLMEENKVESAFINSSWGTVGLADKGKIIRSS